MEDYLIEIQSEETFDVSKDILIRITDVSEEYIKGYVDALRVLYSNKFIHCNAVPRKKPYKFSNV